MTGISRRALAPTHQAVGDKMTRASRVAGKSPARVKSVPPARKRTSSPRPNR